MLVDTQRAGPKQLNEPADRSDRRKRSRPDGTKPVDLPYLHRFTLRDSALQQEILQLFIDHTPIYLKSLRHATTAKEWHDAAHTLKGAARGIGAWRLARAAEAAERLNFGNDPNRRAFAIDSAAEALDEAIGYIGVLDRDPSTHRS